MTIHHSLDKVMPHVLNLLNMLLKIVNTAQTTETWKIGFICSSLQEITTFWNLAGSGFDCLMLMLIRWIFHFPKVFLQVSVAILNFKIKFQKFILKIECSFGDGLYSIGFLMTCYFFYIDDYKFTLHCTEKHRQTKLHDRQIPIYQKVPGSIK